MINFVCFADIYKCIALDDHNLLPWLPSQRGYRLHLNSTDIPYFYCYCTVKCRLNSQPSLLYGPLLFLHIHLHRYFIHFLHPYSCITVTGVTRALLYITVCLYTWYHLLPSTCTPNADLYYSIMLSLSSCTNHTLV